MKVADLKVGRQYYNVFLEKSVVYMAYDKKRNQHLFRYANKTAWFSCNINDLIEVKK